MMSRCCLGPLWAMALLLPSFAGCIALSDPTIQVATPRVGDTYTYAGPEESRIDIRVEGTGTRIDAFLRPHEVVLFNWTFRPKASAPEAGHVYYFEEAVEPATGLIVQQSAHCSPAPRASPEWSDRACLDERAVVVLAAAGAPGAFAAGPHWADSVEPGIVHVPGAARGAGWGAETVVYTVRRNTSLPGQCVDIATTAEVPSTMMVLPQTVIQGPVTLCAGLALPQAFTTVGGERFVLTGHRRGGGEIDKGDQEGALLGWQTVRPTVALRDWRPEEPFVVDPTDGVAEFPTMEAHEWAMENVEEYRRIVDGNPAGLVTNMNAILWGRSESIGLSAVETWSYERRLVATGPNGDGVAVRLLKSQTRAAGNNLISDITLKGTDQVGIDPPVTRESPRNQQADADDARKLARGIIGTELRMLSQEPFFRNHPWADDPTGRTGRSDGYTVVAWQRDPTPLPGAPGGGLAYEAPYQFVIDGPTTAVLWMTVNRSRLPLEIPP